MILVYRHDTGIYTWYWYIHMRLVYTHDTGIYTWDWYIHLILVYTHDTGIYTWYWYIHMILVYTHDTGKPNPPDSCGAFLWSLVLFTSCVFSPWRVCSVVLMWTHHLDDPGLLAGSFLLGHDVLGQDHPAQQGAHAGAGRGSDLHHGRSVHDAPLLLRTADTTRAARRLESCPGPVPVPVPVPFLSLLLSRSLSRSLSCSCPGLVLCQHAASVLLQPKIVYAQDQSLCRRSQTHRTNTRETTSWK